MRGEKRMFESSQYYQNKRQIHKGQRRSALRIFK